MNPEIVGNHATTSRSAVRFLDYSVRQGRCLRKLDLLDDTLPAFLRNYPYTLHSWPWFVGEGVRRSLSDCVCRVPSLIYRAIKAEFGKDASRLASYYKISEVFARVFLESALDPSPLMLRADAILSSRGLKIVEVNAGPSIGGWQIQWMDPQYRKQSALKPFFEENACHSRNIPFEYTKHLITKGREYAANGPVNVLFLVEEHVLVTDVSDTIRILFSMALKECDAVGDVHFKTKFSGVSFTGSGVFVGGERISVIAMLHHETPLELPLDLFRSFLRGQVYWPGSPFDAVMADKRSLAITYMHKDTSLFTTSERELIESHIPWSSAVTSQDVDFRERKWSLRDLILEHREDFVLKSAQSAQGKDVFVGRFQSDEDWANALDRAMREETWLVQEYCASLPFYGQSGDEGYVEHDVVWGVFGFGGNYGGCWLRLMPRDAGDGVVNSAKGAQETIVYEVGD
jgi:hypothetical protein